MEILNFELPSELWKVTKRYGTLGVPNQDIEKVYLSFETWFFQKYELAMEFYSSFEIGSEEFVQINEDYGYKLPVFATLDRVKTVDYLPKVLDY